MYRLIEKIRQQPLPVRQKIVFLMTILVVMVVTVAWFVGSLAKFSLVVEDTPTESQNTAASILQEPYGATE